MSESHADDTSTVLPAMEQQQQQQLMREDEEHEVEGVAVKFEEVSAAAFKIRGSVERTPCIVSVVALFDTPASLS